MLLQLVRQANQALYIHRRCRPLARRELRRWTAVAEAIPDPLLRRQALSSLDRKAFHCEGGAVYAAGAPHRASTLVRAIVALQTLVDYLDNLSDRAGDVDESVLRQLHRAVDDALTPGAAIGQYAAGDDGGYLAQLVAETQVQLAILPGYPAVSDACRRLGGRYSELQVRKHLPDVAAREPALVEWLTPLTRAYPGWRWWELAAACGSTLGIYSLFMAAAEPGAPRSGALLDAYFPWVCGLHILLDYYVDQAEDRDGGDLNFVRYYGGNDVAAQSLQGICREARRRVLALPDPALHLLVVQGLPGLYLSDPKVARQGMGAGARQILRGGGAMAVSAYLYCRAVPPGR